MGQMMVPEAVWDGKHPGPGGCGTLPPEVVIAVTLEPRLPVVLSALRRSFSDRCVGGAPEKEGCEATPLPLACV